MKDQSHIDMSNYEIFVIDYLDGQLSTEDQVALHAFLEQHPELREEIDGLELATLDPIDISTDFKQSLKKTPIHKSGNIDEDNYESYFVAFTENDLNKADVKHLEEFLSISPDLINEFNLFKKVKIQPDASTLFPDKESLKKRRAVSIVWISGIAATLTLFLAITFFLQKEGPNRTRELITLQSFSSKTTTQVAFSDLEDTNLLLHQNNNIASFLIPQKIVENEVKEEIIEEPNIAWTQVQVGELTRKPIQTDLTNILDFHRLEMKNQGITAEPNEYLLAEATPQSTNKRSLFSKIVGGQLAKIGDRFGRNKEQNINHQLEKSEPGYIKVIDRSILVFNTITGSETNVSKTYNSNGHMTNYKVAGNNLYVSRPIESTP